MLHRHYPASSLMRASPPPLTAQPVPRGLLAGSFDLPPWWVSRVAAGLLCAHVLTHTPAIRTRCLLRSLPAPWQPSPCLNRVGVRIALFEACSVFTHIRTCSLADSLARAFDIGSFARHRCQRRASRLLPAERQLPDGILSPTGVLLRVHGALKRRAILVMSLRDTPRVVGRAGKSGAQLHTLQTLQDIFDGPFPSCFSTPGVFFWPLTSDL